MTLRCCLPLAFALCCASAQTDEPHAIVDGKPVSLSDVQALMGSMPPQLQKNADELFRYYGFLNRMAAKGEAISWTNGAATRSNSKSRANRYWRILA